MNPAIPLAEPSSVQCPLQSGAAAVSLEAAAWLASAARSADPCRDRLFLARLAVHLVHQFRSEERSLQSCAPRHFARRCEENRRLALRLRELMVGAELGLELEGGIRDLLRAWQSHQQRPGARRLLAGIRAVA